MTRFIRPKTAPERALKTHADEVRAIQKNLENKGRFVLPFGKENEKFGLTPIQGIVDLVTVKLTPTKIKKRKNILKIVLFDLKRGSAHLSDEKARRRLRDAVKNVRIGYDYAI